MEIDIRPVGEANEAALRALRVAPGQAHHIETVAECLAEAAESDRWHPVGLYAGDLPVGFAMYGAFPAWIGGSGEEQVWLDRLLIDARYQGRGYGEAALRALLARLDAAYRHPTWIYLSVYGDNAPAIALYEKYGFSFTGDLDTKGERVMRCRTRDALSFD